MPKSRLTLVPIPGKREQAVRDMAALLMAKAVKEGEGDATLLHQSFEAILQSPERVGGVALILLNTLYRVTTPQQFTQLIEFFMEEIRE